MGPETTQSSNTSIGEDIVPQKVELVGEVASDPVVEVTPTEAVDIPEEEVIIEKVEKVHTN